jgi:quercetin dioxygenase-like cupin family protein
MQMSHIPFGTTDWSAIAPTRHAGDVGEALWRVQHFGPDENRIRVRMVEYSPGYVSDHWCIKGHVLFCIEGELETTLEDGRHFLLKAGMSYQVADGAEPHRSQTRTGARLFIVD